MEMRTCNSCRLDLPLVLFGKGRHTCKACQKRYREVNQERIRQRKQEYYRKNREEILRTQKEKYSINSDWKEIQTGETEVGNGRVGFESDNFANVQALVQQLGLTLPPQDQFP